MQKRVFITGISGFAGSHLAELLLTKGGYEVFGTVFGDGYRIPGMAQENYISLNLLEREKTISVLREIKPNLVFHLAALSSPALSFKDPRATITNNVEAQINVLDGLVGLSGLERVLVIGSAEEYGQVREYDIPIDEEVELNPRSPYAVSKITQDFLGRQYFLHHKLPVVRVRPFNHTGERQAPQFVIPAFAKQVAEIEAGKQEEVLNVGNLEAIRDFTDVKDMMEAYHVAMLKAIPGEVYNLGSGKGYSIKYALDEILKLAKLKIEIRPDPDRIQPSDIPELVCNATKFRELSGWQPKIPFGQTLIRVLDYWRNEVTK